MANATIGTSGLVFATTDDTYGLIQNLSFNETTQETRASDGVGDVVGAGFYGNLTECSGTYLFEADLNSPSAHVGDGTAVTLSDADSPGNIFITSATTNKSNTEFKSVDFDGIYYPDLGS